MTMELLYQERLKRYVTALRNGKPDRIPIRPFVAEFVARYAGYTCQEVAHDYTKAFEGACKCAADYDWDAVVANMVYVWTGLTNAIGLNYYATPGIQMGQDTGFQYLEPPEERVHMRADEYDALIDDPTAFLYNTWLPRVVDDVVPIGEPSTYKNNLSFVRGAMNMLHYFQAFGPQVERLRRESGTVSAIAGIFKAPFDIIGDKLRGYVGLTEDMFIQPDKVLKACEALMPHLYNVALTSSDPAGLVPIGFWMHRGCVPFIKPDQFDSHYWPTLKPIIEQLWNERRQTLFYAEGDWGYHLDTFRELPDRSIVYHVDRGNIFDTHRKLGDKFCLSGAVSNVTLAYGSPEDVRAECKKIIDEVARDGGYIMDASAIMQNDTKPENLRALTEATREYGVYADGHSLEIDAQPPIGDEKRPGMGDRVEKGRHVGLCVPWSEKEKSLPPIRGDRDVIKNIWEQTDAMANMYIWQILLSF